MQGLEIEENNGGVVFGIKVIPGSSKSEISGLFDGKLKVKVAAAPERGKANQALIDFLAKKLGIKKKHINLTSGHTSPIKFVQVSNMSQKTLLNKLNPENRGSNI
ncbi:MAG: DUF167 domain-containing protein [Planctomycetota bacterium]|jgi:uncharacterized protein (TIGR00251 family)